ncbi:MAG: PQQ-dependent sugar dehydrogenase [Bacteroidota bacterium]|nr:PQQ-dependent sugar dehydrogenase [Bacteroidota bacterium]
MRQIQALIFGLLILMFSNCNTISTKHGQTEDAQNSKNITTKDSLVFKLEEVTDSLYSPLALENAHDGSGRIFIAEQAGRIMVLKDGKLLKEPFLDIQSLLVPLKNVMTDVGLLGFAFHPDYKNNGRFFVHYCAPSKKGFNHKEVLEEFKVSANNPDKANPIGKVILEVEQPDKSHNGGNIVFDKEGYLYLGFGDGGGPGDPHGTIGNGQDLNQLLGKIIRIDVDHGKPYSIPKDNPFVGKEGRDEIWCYGMRMPWRISFDEKTGELFCGDVGESKYEEVDIIQKGKNYGWRAMEGFHPFDSTLYAKGGDFTPPVIEYPHPEGICIIGGYVYRGKQFPALEGKYIFGDWASKVFYMDKNANQQWVKHDCKFEGNTDNKFKFKINSFGIDEAGEIYVVTQNEAGAISPSGVVYKLTLANQ